MIKQNWNISTEEAKRILMMHESATKNQYLINEQKIVVNKLEPKKFTLPNNTFPSGKYKEFNRADVDKVVQQLLDYVKNFPKNQQIKLEIESSESKVPNKGVGLEPGKLSELRGEEMKNYLKSKLPTNITLEMKNLGAQGPQWKRPSNATPEQIRQLANDPSYTQYQYVSFNIVGSGENEKEICELGFSVLVDYRKEWCIPDVDESKCHKCNEAVFNMFANGILLTNEKGDPQINLNNDFGREKSGPSVSFKLVVSAQQKQQILAVNPEEIIITYNCALRDCHSDPAHITIVSDNGQVLLPGTFITTGGQRMSNANPPVTLLKLNKCGEVITTAGADNPKVEEPKPRVQPFKLKLDANSNYSIDTIYELYKFVGEDGILRIPNDQLELFRTYKAYNNKPWTDFANLHNIGKSRQKELEQYKQSKGNQ
jgi:hypothetical protein